MKESVIKQYFEGEEAAASLKTLLASVRNTSVLTKGENLDCDLHEDYTVTTSDLKRICDDFLAGFLDADDVCAIAFFLFGADHFVWDKGTESGAVVAEIIDDWNSPEIDFPINRRNMKMIARGLDEGVYDVNTLRAKEGET